MRLAPPFAWSLALVLVAVAGCDSGADGDAVAASGTITNSFDRPLAGGTVTFEEAASAGKAARRACTAQTDASGRFECDLPPGRYDVTVEVPGYSTDTFPITVDASGNATLDLPPLTGQGNIDAEFVDAISGAVLTFADVQCSRQLPDGTYTELDAQTDNAGEISIQNVFLGQARCIVQAGASQIPVILTIEEDTAGTIPVTEPPPSGSYRVVLRWGQAPSDLDSHLTGPIAGSGARFHVYYSDTSYESIANLDRDDTSSFGPETVTFTPTADGVYRYTVHNYTFRGSTEGGQSIADSPTTVELFDDTGLIQTYTAPPPSSANNGLVSNSWRVFELTKTGGSVSFSNALNGQPDRGQPGLRYVLADSPSDLDVFLTGGSFPDKAASL